MAAVEREQEFARVDRFEEGAENFELFGYDREGIQRDEVLDHRAASRRRRIPSRFRQEKNLAQNRRLLCCLALLLVLDLLIPRRIKLGFEESYQVVDLEKKTFHLPKRNNKKFDFN